jgi:ferredoxin
VLDHGRLVIRPIESASELPRGVMDEQAPGSHRLRREGDRHFDYTVPADSWKRLFFPPRLRQWSATARDGQAEITPEPDPVAPVALLGVRGCDLAAIAVQDRVFLRGEHPDPHYRARREGAFIVAVNCARACATCFCTSMGTGPRAREGYDLSLTELAADRFHVDAGSDRGEEVLHALGVAPVTAAETEEAERILAATAASITRTMPPDIARTLRASFDSPRWQSIAERCLACGNCTLVCPTCFCTAAEDTTDLEGVAYRERRWDSCFSAAHSYIHGGSVRPSTAPRYRQWMTHKLSTWHDQFGTSGCVGCGRCITWCPVAIDITAEAHAFTAQAAGGSR